MLIAPNTKVAKCFLALRVQQVRFILWQKQKISHSYFWTGPQNYQKMDLKAMDVYLDFWNLMAYDYAGSWDAKAGHQSNLYPSSSDPSSTPFSSAKAIEYYRNQGISPSKIVLGMPLYGRAFASTNGVGHSFTGTGEGSWEVCSSPAQHTFVQAN